MFAKFLVLAVLSAVFQDVSLTPIKADEDDGMRIVGGVSVTIRSEYPYQASLRYYGSHYCGGSIIDEKHILTAAHCCFVAGNPVTTSEVTVVVGDLNIYQTDKTTVRKNVNRIYIHEDYDTESREHDIAILEVEDSFSFSEEISSITPATTTPDAGTLCDVSGWGYLEEDSQVLSSGLQAVSIPLVNRVTCNSAYMGRVTSNMICAGQDGGGKDACQGDSGGPLVCGSYLVGVVSWGVGCARNRYPGVYTEVAKHLSWIHSITNVKIERLKDQHVSQILNNKNVS